MAKLILLVVIFLTAWWLLRNYLRSLLHRGDAENPPPASEQMVRCEHCGVHLPRSECISRDGRLFCGEEHSGMNR